MHRYYAECKKRASLVPAAAVIPALRAYIKVVAFKTPVVEIAWSGVQERGRKGGETTGKEMQYACSSALRERKKEKERGRREKACALFNECIQLLSKNFLPLGTSLSLEVCAGCVCVKHFFCLFLPLFSLTPLGACLVFCYHKEIGVSIAGRALVAQAPVHCSME